MNINGNGKIKGQTHWQCCNSHQNQRKIISRNVCTTKSPLDLNELSLKHFSNLNNQCPESIHLQRFIMLCHNEYLKQLLGLELLQQLYECHKRKSVIAILDVTKGQSGLRWRQCLALTRKPVNMKWTMKWNDQVENTLPNRQMLNKQCQWIIWIRKG